MVRTVIYHACTSRAYHLGCNKMKSYLIKFRSEDYRTISAETVDLAMEKFAKEFDGCEVEVFSVEIDD
jgi:hypothetical protein